MRLFHLNSKMRSIVIISLLGIMAWEIPRLYIAAQVNSLIYQLESMDSDDIAAREKCEAKLVAIGNNAEKPIINAIAINGIHVAATYSLIRVLSKRGMSAHTKLIESIGSERDKRKQINLIFALQDGFRDYSQINIWFQNLKSDLNVSYTAPPLRLQISKYVGEDAPDVLANDAKTFNPQFVSWYVRKSTQDKKLPPCRISCEFLLYPYIANMRKINPGKSAKLSII